MEITRDQLADALYQKGLALLDIESQEVRVFMLQLLFIRLTNCDVEYHVCVIAIFCKTDQKKER